MSIVGGFDVHRKRITFDYLDTVTGEVQRGQIGSADRRRLAGWLQRFAGRDDVAFAAEACTGWRYVIEELQRAGVAAHLAEPADTAAARGRKRRAKTDRADAQLIRTWLAEDRLPECDIPPPQVVEYRALLELYHALRREHTAWVQRIQAVLFHPGAGASGLGRGEQPGGARPAGRGRRRSAVPGRVGPGRDRDRDAPGHRDSSSSSAGRQLVRIARHVRGAKTLTDSLYGVGPITALALTCWLGGADRFSSARKAVRFAGLDVTVYSSAGKRSPGHLSRQGPPVLRWCLYEAGHTHARPAASDHDYYASVKHRIDGRRAALSEARKIVRHGLPHPHRPR